MNAPPSGRSSRSTGPSSESKARPPSPILGQMPGREQQAQRHLGAPRAGGGERHRVAAAEAAQRQVPGEGEQRHEGHDEHRDPLAPFAGERSGRPVLPPGRGELVADLLRARQAALEEDHPVRSGRVDPGAHPFVVDLPGLGQRLPRLLELVGLRMRQAEVVVGGRRGRIARRRTLIVLAGGGELALAEVVGAERDLRVDVLGLGLEHLAIDGARDTPTARDGGGNRRSAA